MKSTIKRTTVFLFAALVLTSCQDMPEGSHIKQIVDKMAEMFGDNDLPKDADMKEIELISKKLGYDNFTEIEDGVYMTNDSLQIFVFLPEKWETYIDKMDFNFPYDVIDYATNEKYLELPFPEYLSEFEFVGIIELYEHALDLREYQHQQGKLYAKTDRDSVFWNIEAEQFDAGENITNIVIIE